MDLVQLILPRKQRKQAQDLKENASNAPYIHLVVVVAFGEEALRGAVPPGGDVFGVPLSFHPFTGPKVNELHIIILQQDVLPEDKKRVQRLRFDVAVEDPIAVHQIQSLK